jgi:radical SAM superfamily enzyme YgiQ (UPF0313 family)
MTKESVIHDRLSKLNRNADILFVNCPHYNVQFPNSGIAYLCEAVKAAGYVPEVLDINILMLHKYRPTGLTEYWEDCRNSYFWLHPRGFEKTRRIFEYDLQQFAAFIAELPIPIIGFAVNMLNERFTDEIVRRVRSLSPEKSILFGGYSYFHKTIAPEVSDLPDAVAIGDAEQSVVSYIAAKNNGLDVSNIPGLIVRTENGWGQFMALSSDSPVDQIPWPRWEEFNLSDYTFLCAEVHLPIHSSRGCRWGRCNFCSAAPTNPGYRHRQAESIFAEMKHAYHRYAVTGFYLTTLQANGDMSQLGHLCDLIIDSGIKFRTYGQFTFDKQMTYKFCSKLNRAGFKYINFGMESGSDDLLRAMNKGFNVKTAERVLKHCHDAGIIAGVNIIVGHPAETEERFQETLNFFSRNWAVINKVEIAPPLKLLYGSEMWNDPGRFGIRFERKHNQWIVEDWSSIDGANTFALRQERQARLLEHVKSLGIESGVSVGGHATRKLNFRENPGQEFRNSFFRTIVRSHIESMLPSDISRVLLIRSCPHEQVQAFAEEIKQMRPSIELSILLQPSCEERYRKIQVIDKAVTYENSALFDLTTFDKNLLHSMTASRYDAVIFFYGSMGRETYGEVLRLAMAIGNQRVFGVSMTGDFETFAVSKSNNIRLRSAEAFHSASPFGNNNTASPPEYPSFSKLFSADTDVLLVNAPQFNIFYPPSGIAYVGEYIKAAGFSVGVFDLNIALVNRYRDCGIERFWHAERAIEYWAGPCFPEVERRFAEDFEEAAQAIASTRSPVIGFSVNMMNLRASDLIAARVRDLAPTKTIVYGGYSCYHAELCRHLSSEPDYICVGESEATSAELMHALFNEGDPGAVPGVMEVRRGTRRYIPRSRKEMLDQLLWPRWLEFDFSQYHTVTPFHTVSVNASRGCAWARCHFCSDSKTTPGFRRRSAGSLLEEIRHGYEQQGTRHFHLSDLIVNGDHAELERFCNLLLSSGMSICFSGQFHIDRRLTPELLHKLKAAGMPIINFGLETGSDRMMKLMRKGYNLRIAQDCIRHAKEAGLIVDINLLVGFPGETMEDVQETARFLERNRPYIDIVEVVNICSIHFGSDLWVESSRFGVQLNPQPGAREDREWISADGTNTFEERIRRSNILKAKIDDLKLGKGHHSQEFRFVPSSDAHFLPESYLAKLRLSSHDISLPNCNRALVLRSCDMVRAILLLQGIRNVMPRVCIDLLLQESIREQLTPLVNGEAITYPGGPLSLERVPADMVDTLAGRGYDAVIVPYGNMPEESYTHVLTLARSLGSASLLTISPGGMIQTLALADHKLSRSA